MSPDAANIETGNLLRAETGRPIPRLCSRDACQNPYPILLNNSSITSGFARLLQTTTNLMVSETLFGSRRITSPPKE